VEAAASTDGLAVATILFDQASLKALRLRNCHCNVLLE
jgi:hypothetical protein